MKKIFMAIALMASLMFSAAAATNNEPTIKIGEVEYLLNCFDGAESRVLLERAQTVVAFAPTGKSSSDWAVVVKMLNGHLMVDFSDTVEVDPATGEAVPVDYASVMSSFPEDDLDHWFEYNGKEKGYCYAQRAGTEEFTILIYE